MARKKAVLVVRNGNRREARNPNGGKHPETHRTAKRLIRSVIPKPRR